MLKSILLLVSVIILLAPAAANAHSPNPRACNIAWQTAAPGNKWNAMQKCRVMQRNHRLKHSCTHRRPLIAYTTVKHRKASLQKRRNLTIALNEAYQMRAPRIHMIALVAAITQESSADNLPYGDGSSVGILQLINTHGTVAWRMRITNSAGWFLRGAHKTDPRGFMNPATLAQRVQRSRYPYAYQQWVNEASRTVGRFLGVCAQTKPIWRNR